MNSHNYNDSREINSPKNSNMSGLNSIDEKANEQSSHATADIQQQRKILHAVKIIKAVRSVEKRHTEEKIMLTKAIRSIKEREKRLNQNIVLAHDIRREAERVVKSQAKKKLSSSSTSSSSPSPSSEVGYGQVAEAASPASGRIIMRPEIDYDFDDLVKNHLALYAKADNTAEKTRIAKDIISKAMLKGSQSVNMDTSESHVDLSSNTRGKGINQIIKSLANLPSNGAEKEINQIIKSLVDISSKNKGKEENEKRKNDNTQM
jgi:hypothetical protein